MFQESESPARLWAVGCCGVLLAVSIVPLIACADGGARDGVADAPPRLSATPDERQASPAPPEDASSNLTGEWAARQRLADQGISFDLHFVADGTRNLRGGLDTERLIWRRMFEATLTLDSKPLLGIEGGTFFADFQY